MSGSCLGQPRQLVFVWPNGNPLHPDTITALFHKHCEAAGLPRIRLHDVMHSYATAALKAGISAKVISERLGHCSAAFTLQPYTHVIPGMDEMAADTVAKLILAAPAIDSDTDGTILGTIPEDEGPEIPSAPGKRAANREKPRSATVPGTTTPEDRSPSPSTTRPSGCPPSRSRPLPSPRTGPTSTSTSSPPSAAGPWARSCPRRSSAG
jgi:hypothetical protein